VELRPFLDELERLEEEQRAEEEADKLKQEQAKKAGGRKRR
jgi:hypothetical protein